jgi:hypothetical protein
VGLVEPLKEKQKMRVIANQKSALVPGDGQSMSMELD